MSYDFKMTLSLSLASLIHTHTRFSLSFSPRKHTRTHTQHILTKNRTQLGFQHAANLKISQRSKLNSLRRGIPPTPRIMRLQARLRYPRLPHTLLRIHANIYRISQSLHQGCDEKVHSLESRSVICLYLSLPLSFSHSLSLILSLSLSLSHSFSLSLTRTHTSDPKNNGKQIPLALGGKCTEAHASQTLTPIVALCYQQCSPTQFNKTLNDFVRAHQNNNVAVEHAQTQAVILKSLCDGNTPLDAIKAGMTYVKGLKKSDTRIVAALTKVLSVLSEDDVQVTSKFGKSCPLKHSFPAAIHSFLRHSNSFRECLNAVSAAGGDSAHRGGIVGSLIGAYLGFEGLPAAWVKKVKNHQQILKWVDTIVETAVKSNSSSKL